MNRSVIKEFLLGPGQTQAFILCLVGYALFEAKDLVFAWRTSPFDALGWLAFAIWVAPLFVTDRPMIRETGLIVAGVGLLLAGHLGELNALKYGGLAGVLAGLEPWRKGRFFWLVTGIAWMPAFGYLVSQGLSEGVWLVRILIAAAGTITLIRVNRRSFEQELAV